MGERVGSLTSALKPNTNGMESRSITHLTFQGLQTPSSIREFHRSGRYALYTSVNHSPPNKTGSLCIVHVCEPLHSQQDWVVMHCTSLWTTPLPTRLGRYTLYTSVNHSPPNKTGSLYIVQVCEPRPSQQD